MSSHNKARLQIVFSMAVWGTIPLFTRNITIPSGEMALYRGLLAAGFMAIYLLLTRQLPNLRAMGRDLPKLALCGAAMGFNWILLFEAYKYTTVSIATLSYYFAPVLVTILSPLLFHEKLSRRGIFCFIMSTIGLVLIIGTPTAVAGRHGLGIALGLGAAVLYASVVLINKSISDVSGLHRTIVQFMAAIAILIPYVLSTGGLHPQALDGKGLICLLILGLLHTGITYCLYFSNLKSVSGQEAAILSYVDPLVAVLVSVALLHEPMTLPQLVGGALILGFTIWNELE
ncbi:MAG: EamA family transporter [Clostridia bacterium]|nr:EamA family transporter [Clostridia bacterium]